MRGKRSTNNGPIGLDALGEIGSRLGDLLGAVQSTLEKASEKGGSGESQTDFTTETAKGPLKTSVGWRIKVGGMAGGHAGSTAADRSEVKSAPAEKPVREPLVDVFVEPDHVLVTAELPGVSAKDVSLRSEGSTLIIETTGSNRFRADVVLPETVDASVAPGKALRNGILELRFKLKA